MSDKPLSSQCSLIFMCSGQGVCVYHDGEETKCKHRLDMEILDEIDVCNSAVARANAMVLELQRMGFTVELKAKEGEG